MNYASHLGLPAIVIPLKSENCSNLARIITTHILSGHNHQVNDAFKANITLKLQGLDIEQKQ
jgi:hypothetical protein